MSLAVETRRGPSMRRWLLLALLAFSLPGCLSFSSSPAPPPVVVVPPGSQVICPNGTPATFDNGVYRC